MVGIAFGGYLGGAVGIEGVPGKVHGVAAHIADLPATEVVIDIPLEAVGSGGAGEVFGVVGVVGCGSEP